ncbi:MAG: cytochrome c maturation protein CcmE [Armatimonadota bacterium]|nr:cytochrome c maturation protein CcmE [Armatimonadota bacterium]
MTNPRFIIGPLIVVVAVIWLVLTGIRSNTLRALPVGEVRAGDTSPHSFVGQRLRVVGFVAPSNVRVEPRQTPGGIVNVNHFEVVDNQHRLAVVYSDTLPDTFKPGGPVQVDGVYERPGFLRADHVLTKCPSKYEAEKAAKDAAPKKSPGAAKQTSY